MTTAMYAVEGMMCDSCRDAVLENVGSLSGVSVVAMDLVTGGRSPLLVTSGTRLGADAVRDVVGQVGFGVTPPKVPERRERGSSPPVQDGDTHADSARTISIGGLSS
jgi:copper chaperone CopZ